MKQLTRAEEQIIQILWDLEKAYVRDILDRLPKPKPAYNTVSTIVRILEKKGFVGYKSFGKAHEYYPLISKKEYRKSYFKRFLSNYFGNSYMALTSFFTKEQDLSLQELEEIKKLIDEKIDQKKK
ncbi:MAG: BlaI/MecI/CopY family transcriptional regulator [Bacteroidetes bacterium]|nr:MAG: BlaI/MecI/CopY family transcriptional regulator [Bacteroidota bacterium]RLD72189.1 MAG: BlaI/MecI/CopY family transcriptional regulator [Bacteroidota bacterium]RLD87217.1 MAG: BlaI/MecI/CopY family transcriptional regulator [Bacteroidota bacterium]HHL57452.1 BlaI/MecI/CopY family transcriptional regulator [Bacteroidota bacterium]